ncbi:MAG: phosphatidylserine decarboxylase family protein [Planctomycetes bacterium]|nr:phosphatidylserine decarboxylase family protein [Planctomycetota bacterium]
MLSRNGADQWIPATLVAVPVMLGCAWLALRGEAGWWLPFGVTAVAWLGFLAFFRDPSRTPPPMSDRTMVSPADGLVSAVLRQAQHEAVDGPALVIRVYLSVLDVHVNRVPWSGRVLQRSHRPGRYVDVRVAESAKVNESMLLTLQASEGFRFGVRLVSGAVARRIACTARVGDTLNRGDRMGMIKFGSTTELVVPDAEFECLVQVGDRVRGAETALARRR